MPSFARFLTSRGFYFNIPNFQIYCVLTGLRVVDKIDNLADICSEKRKHVRLVIFENKRRESQQRRTNQNGKL